MNSRSTASKRIAGDLDVGRRWWNEEWARWQPDPSWPVPPLPAGWEDVPLTRRP